MKEPNLKCPTCERGMPKPRAWWDGFVIWGNVLMMSTFVAWIILDPPASLIKSCLKAVKAGIDTSSTGSCYAPPEPWLALGWIAYAACIVFAGLLIYSGFVQARKDRERWTRIGPRMVEAPPETRSWLERL